MTTPQKILIGILSIISALLIAIIVAFWKFTPIVHFGGNRVSILGGLIEVDESGLATFPEVPLDEETLIKHKDVRGSHPSQDSNQPFQIVYGNGEVDVQSAQTDKVSWSCKVWGKDPHQLPHGIDFSRSDGVDCKIKVPVAFPLNIVGGNGQVTLMGPFAPVDVSLGNGHVILIKNPTTEYAIQSNVKNGQGVPNTASSNGVKVHVTISNGQFSLR